MEYLIIPFKKMFILRGRTSRKEFWYWRIWVVALSIILNSLGGIEWFGALTWLCWVGMGIADYSIMIRRMHDTNHSGFMLVSSMFLSRIITETLQILNYENEIILLLCNFVYFPTIITILILSIKKGDEQINQYGCNPKSSSIA